MIKFLQFIFIVFYLTLKLSALKYNYEFEFKKVCRDLLGIKGKILHSLRYTFFVSSWATTGGTKMISQ